MELKDAILKWLADYPGVFTFTELKEGIHLTEIATRKERRFFYPEVKQWRRKANPEGVGDYLNLVFENGHELVLCHAGFAFSPSYLSTGQVQGLPEVLCFQDFYRFKTHLDHLYQNPQMKKEAVRTLMTCMALLEGAKLVGLDISAEEKSLEIILNWLEIH